MKKMIGLACFAAAWGVVACGAEASDSTSDSEIVRETARTEADFAGVDCRAACPGVPIGGARVGPISGSRVAAVQFQQLASCAVSSAPAPAGFHTKRAGEPCSLGATPSHGQAVAGDLACEEFECAETGSLRASACVAPSISSASAFRMPPGQCATKAVACAAAREVFAARATEPRLCL